MILRRRFDYFCYFVVTTLILSDGGCTLFQHRSPLHTLSVGQWFGGWRKSDASADGLFAGPVCKSWPKKSNSNVREFPAGRMFNTWRRQAGARVNKLPSGRLFKNGRRKVSAHEKKWFDRIPYNVEVTYTPPEVIRNRGYPAEIHHVTTEDGYILELHRIPATPSADGTPRKVVLLQHGVLESSGTWVVNPSNRSLPFLLSSKSYDVWMGNFRGNRYSRRHVRLKPSQTDFWRFSWDEIGNFDIPVVIHYILDVTGRPTLSYVGHSLGAGVLFIAMLKHPELNAKIDAMVGLAPLSSFAHFTTALFRILAPFGNAIETFLRMIGTWGWLDSAGLGDIVLQLACSQTYQQANRCAKGFDIIAGPNPGNLHPDVIPLALANILHGTSVPMIAQFAQNFHAGEKFQAYDYGRKGNRKRYGTDYPRQYVLANVTTPVYIYSGGNDRIVTPRDVDWLLTQLGNIRRSVRIDSYNHGDFLWGTDVKETLYDQVMADLPPP